MRTRGGEAWPARARLAVAHLDDPLVERKVLATVSAVAFLGYAAWWRRAERYSDSVSYEIDAVALTSGWHHILERTPGYPLLVWATGSTDGPSLLLFALQLALTVATAWLGWSVARRLAVVPAWRLLLVLLLLSPPVAQCAAYEETEGVAMFCAMVVLATGTRALHSRRWAVACGAAAGAAAMVRPALVLVGPVVAIALVLATRGERRLPGAARMGARLLVPWLLFVGGYVGLNAVRFDQPTISPLLPWHLSTTTVSYVEALPPSFEPLRSKLVEERDRAILVPGTDHKGTLYVACLLSNPDCPRHRLARELGVSDEALSRWMLRADEWLILHKPQSFMGRAGDATGAFLLPFTGPRLDDRAHGQPAAIALGWTVVLLGATPVVGLGVLALGFLAVVRRLRRDVAWASVVGGAILVVNWVQCVIFETGAQRQRVATDGVALFLGVLGFAVLTDLRRELSVRPG